MDSPQDNNDLRPISILPVLSKIYEVLAHNQVLEFLENHHLLDNNYIGELIFERRIRLVINIFDNLTETITSSKAAQPLASKAETRCGKIT